MEKSLVIAEKPSVAATIAKVIGPFPEEDDYFENEQYVITSAIGHLVELCLPNEIDKKGTKWSFANLPIIPSSFCLKPIRKTISRFQLICKLLRRKDIVEVINACDAGREGELIFRYLMQLSENQKPTRRLWLQSMTSEAIHFGFSNLRQEKEVASLGEAAICRSESDWLIGINGTRAMTALHSRSGRFQLTPVGRVQTPTLTILVEREEKICSFKPRTYFEVLANFSYENGTYLSRWFDPSFKQGSDEDARAERLWNKEKAEAIRDKCQGKQGMVIENKRPSSQNPPLLYDLTSLQREANIRYSLSARQTLQIVQTLYEHHKAVTYPRTDSRYLPEDHLSAVCSILGSIREKELHMYASKALAQGWINLTKRVFDNTKVTDHHAIIPTEITPKQLDAVEEKVYDMIMRRLIAIFYPVARYQLITRTTVVEGERFWHEEKILIELGWLAVYGKQLTEQGMFTSVLGTLVLAKKLDVYKKQTKPPARYSEATLLSAMEGAGRLLEDTTLRAAMQQRGLGTPATRAQIIEGLITDGYVTRHGRELIATAKGISLTHLLRDIGVKALCSPKLTGEWEYKLKLMEADQFDRKIFMKEIRFFTERIVEKTKVFSAISLEGSWKNVDIRCPKCHTRGFQVSFHACQCKGCGLLLWKNIAGRQFTTEEIRILLEIGSVGPLEGFCSKKGRPFVATVKLDKGFKVKFDFGASSSEVGKQQVDFSSAHIIAACPVCYNGHVYDTGSSYCCNNVPAKGCTLSIGKIILQREIPLAQIIKLLQSGKTELISKFLSKKGRRFSAYLVLENGRIRFEFLGSEHA